MNMNADTQRLSEAIAALGEQMGLHYEPRLIEFDLAANYFNTAVLKNTLLHQAKVCREANVSVNEDVFRDVIAELESHMEENKEYWGDVKTLFSDKIEGLTVSFYQNDCSGEIKLDGNEVAEFGPDFSRKAYLIQDDTGRQWTARNIKDIMSFAEKYVKDSFDIQYIAKPQRDVFEK